MGKYPIGREFFPFSKFTPPVKSVEQAAAMGKFLKEPKWLWKRKDVSVRRESIKGHKGEPVDVLVMEPQGVGEHAPCLLYYHGGGFVFPAAWYHYKLAVKYGCGVGCKVVFVQYRLIPNVSHPTPVEDCYQALLWVMGHAGDLGIDAQRIGVCGDSAGGSLSAAVSQMARDRLGVKLSFQMLIYPSVGCGQDTQSNLRFTDTPMWNSTLSKLILNSGYLSEDKAEKPAYASPIKAESFECLPDAYIETAEFDCLHDDGILYAQKLRKSGGSVELYETKGTMHGFDIVQKAPTTKAAVERRNDSMRKAFGIK